MRYWMAELWMPGCLTKPLSEDFPTDGDKLIRFAELAWKSPESPKGLQLDDWQKDLIRRVLERYPDDHPKYPGQLRFRQVVISLGRQNGKSVLGAVFALYGLLFHEPGPIVVSLASNVDQAGIIYKRVKFVVDGNPTLRKRFGRSTDTRGMSTIDGGSYKVYAAKGASLQGIPVSLCLFDELHIGKQEMWSAMVLGTAQRQNGLVLGITTAGDEESELLKYLYEQGRKAAAGDPELERFGFFLWEAPEGAAVDDPVALMAANPAIACGRMDLETAINDIRLLPEMDARRYRLNQFVASTSNWLPMNLWNGCEKAQVPADVPVVFTVDRTPEWTYATITATAKKDGRLYTEVVASIVKPTQDQLLNLCMKLSRHKVLTFAMDGYALGGLAKALKERGLPVQVASQKDVTNASGLAYANISTGLVSHAHDPLLAVQNPRAVRKNIGETWRISKRDSTVEIDAVMATVIGLYYADQEQGEIIQLF